MVFVLGSVFQSVFWLNALAWIIHAKAFNQFTLPISTVEQSKSVSSDTLKAKECSLLILLYGETQDKDIADPIKKHCG